jgi:integrase
MSREDYGSGSIKERSPGRWLVTVEVPRDARTGSRRRKRFTVVGTRRDAQAARREALAKRDREGPVITQDWSLSDWLERWLEGDRNAGHVSAKSHDRYRVVIERHLTPALGRLKLDELRPDQIAQAKDAWLSGRRSTARQPLSAATVHKHLVVLRRALAEAVKLRLIAVNPADDIQSPSVRPLTERRALTEEEIRLLITAARGTRYDLPIRLTLATGLRQGELLGLRWDDVDLDAGTLSVRRTLSYVAGALIFGPPKTDRSRRVIELSAASVSALRDHRTEQYSRRLMLGPAWQENDLVFPSTLGAPWLSRVLYRGFRQVVNRSEIANAESVTWHCMRHTAATQWLLHGVDVFTVSRRLGHASAAFTMDVYGHMLRGQQREAAESLDHLLA